MYYWQLINKSEDELVKKFYLIQKQHRCKDDWVEEIEKNLHECNINLSESEIKDLKQAKFKSLVQTQIRLKANEYLSSLRAKHSKSEHLLSYSFQGYLKSELISTEDQKLLFQLRTRSTPTKANYKNKFKFDMSCRFCLNKQTVESDIHLLSCPTILDALQDNSNMSSVEHKDIYDDLAKQSDVVKVYKEIFKFIKTKFEVWTTNTSIEGPCSTVYFFVISVLCLCDIFEKYVVDDMD